MSKVRATSLDRRAERIGRVGKRTCVGGKVGRCRQLGVHSHFTGDQMTWHLDDYRCTLLCEILKGSFQETAPRKTTDNTVKHCGGGVGLVVANHRGGGESSMVVTTLDIMIVVHDLPYVAFHIFWCLLYCLCGVSAERMSNNSSAVMNLLEPLSTMFTEVG